MSQLALMQLNSAEKYPHMNTSGNSWKNNLQNIYFTFEFLILTFNGINLFSEIFWYLTYFNAWHVASLNIFKRHCNVHVMDYI